MPHLKSWVRNKGASPNEVDTYLSNQCLPASPMYITPWRVETEVHPDNCILNNFLHLSFHSGVQRISSGGIFSPSSFQAFFVEAGAAGRVDGLVGGVDGFSGGVDGFSGGVDGFSSGVDDFSGGVNGFSGGVDGFSG